MRVLGLLLVLLRGSAAAQPAAFDAALFQSLQAGNGIIVLQFVSPHCEVCSHQEDAMERIAQDPVEKSPAFLQVPFERETVFRSRYKVSSVSTLLILKGSVELGRESGLEGEDEIRNFIRASQERCRGKPRRRPKRQFHPKR